VFVAGKPFLPSKMFVRKAGAYPSEVKHLSGTPLKGKLLAMLTNNGQGRKGLQGANTIAYYKNS